MTVPHHHVLQSRRLGPPLPPPQPHFTSSSSPPPNDCTNTTCDSHQHYKLHTGYSKVYPARRQYESTNSTAGAHQLLFRHTVYRPRESRRHSLSLPFNLYRYGILSYLNPIQNDQMMILTPRYPRPPICLPRNTHPLHQRRMVRRSLQPHLPATTNPETKHFHLCRRVVRRLGDPSPQFRRI